MIALTIILAILALLFLLLLFPVRFHVRADLTSARVELVFLFFRKKLVPQTKKRKKGGKLTTQSLIMSAVSNGFSVQDLNNMTIGMLMDAVSEKIPDGDREIQATQEDIRRML
jgi:hypothetical protein